MQRRRRNEASNPLTPADQPFVDQDLDRADHREAADPELLGELRLAVDPLACRLTRDVRPQPVHQLTVKRSSGLPVEGEAVRAGHGETQSHG